MKLIPECTAIILAGGRSLRMGRDKADVMLAGASMLNRCVMAMQTHFEHLVVSVRAPRARFDIPQLCDYEEMERGPMAGILSVLDQVETPWVFALACDMPLMSVDIIDYMATCRGDQQAVVAVVGGSLQPLAAFYSKAALPEMRRRMQRGERSLRSLLRDLDTMLVEEDQLRVMDPELLGFMDIDSDLDLRKAEAVLGAPR